MDENGCLKFESSSDQVPPVEEVLDLERLTLNPPQVETKQINLINLSKNN